MTLHIGHPEPPCYPRGVNMMGISDASIIDRLQMSQNQLRSPREHQMGRVRVNFRVPCVKMEGSRAILKCRITVCD